MEREFEKLPLGAQAKLYQRMEKFRTGTASSRDIDHLGDGLLEIRVRIGSNPFRLIFFCDARTCVALTTFKKKDQQTPKRYIDLAKERRSIWLGQRRPM